MFNENCAFFKYIEKNIYGITSIQDIEEFERNYDIKLAYDFKEFLIKYNGIILGSSLKKGSKSYILGNIYLDKDSNYFWLDVFGDLQEIKGSFLEYLNDPEKIDQKNIIQKQKIVPIAGDMGANSELGIGYGEDNFGKIYAWSLGWDYEIFFICDSFKEFIEGYYLIELDEDGEQIGTEKIFVIE